MMKPEVNIVYAFANRPAHVAKAPSLCVPDECVIELDCLA